MVRYKVVTQHRGKLYSIAFPPKYKPFSHEYQIGKETVANIGGLFVFRTKSQAIKEAKQWIHCGIKAKILKVEVNKEDKIDFFPADSLVGLAFLPEEKVVECLKALWDGSLKSENPIPHPQGTECYKKVLPIEEVPFEYKFNLKKFLGIS